MYDHVFSRPSRSFQSGLRSIREGCEKTPTATRTRTPSPASSRSLGEWCESETDTDADAPSAARPEDFGPASAATRPPSRPSVQAALDTGLDEALASCRETDPERMRPLVLERLERQLRDSLHRLDQPGVHQPLDQAWIAVDREIDALLQEAQADEGRALDPAEQAVFQYLQRVVLRGAFTRFALEDDLHFADALAAMRRAAVALVAQGLNTPAAVDRWLRQAQAHDHVLQVLMGGAGQLGFAAGFYLFSLVLAPQLAPRLLGRGWMPAFAFGSLAGLVVGLCDALATAGAGQVVDGMAHQRRPNANGAAAALHTSQARRIAAHAGIGAGTVFLKNFLLRVVVQSLAIEALAPRGIDRGLRGATDLALDTAGSVFAGALAAHLRHVLLDDRHAQAFRMLSGDDLQGLVAHVERPLAQEDFGQAVRLFARGAGRALTAPSTCAVVLGTVAPMVGVLMAAQNALPAGLGAVAPMAASAAEVAARVLGPELQASPPVQSYENAVRAGVSTVLMSLLAAFATAVGEGAGPRLDSLALRCHLREALDLVGVLRDPGAGEAPSEAPVFRRRS